MILTGIKSISNCESACQAGKLWVPWRTVTRQIKREAHLLLDLGARFQIVSTQSSIADGSCRILFGNNEGNRNENRKSEQTTPNTEKHGL